MEQLAPQMSATQPQCFPNPVKCKEGRGVRNFDCVHYDDCLEKAAKGMWSGFTCKDCIHYE
ncbi:MAG: hypothetical protein D6722_27085 [Bacteroidetes bacterium]|nr:MAG: hypothetical protein D6722_27085 [Bacteroidota bacterium]